MPANPQIAPPTIIFRNKQTGKVETAIIRNQSNPYGMEREELKGPFERSKFEKEQQAKHDIENAIVTERNFTIKNETRKNRQSDIRARLSGLAESSENPEFTKDLMKLAMERDTKKELPHKKTEFHLVVNHQDRNNLDKA